MLARFSLDEDGDVLLSVEFPQSDLDESEIKALGDREKIDAQAAGGFVQGGGVAPNSKVRLDSCCRPVPGDRIVGIMQPDKSLVVHTIDCPRLADFEDREDLWRDLRWTAEADRNGLGLARIRATIRDAPGVLGEACTIIGEAGGNILNLNMHHRQSDYFDVDFDVEVKDNRHLTNIMAALRACPSVDTADRALG